MKRRPSRTPLPIERLHAVGVVVPAHDEEASIVACMRSIDRAAALVRSSGIAVIVVVVCDACTDRTVQRVVEHGLEPVITDGRNVGSARARGAEAALRAGADWLAFTDADTVVCDNWLMDQLSIRADAVCGTIGIRDWGPYDARMHAHFRATYTDADGHRHVHGANFGLTARAYRRVGGFQPLESHEDVALVDALVASNIEIAWSAKPRVWTSARKTYRAPNGFGATLERVAQAFCDSVVKSATSPLSLPKITKAAPFKAAGKITPDFVRFSTVAGERGAADTARDVRGFAVKFYTDEGNWDIVGNNMPVFFIEDAIKFPDLIHAAKPEPHNGMPQGATAHDTFGDFVSLSPESTHMLMWAMSDRALPRSDRMMQGFGVHSFRLINEAGDSTYVKFHWKPLLGTHSLVWDEAVKIAGADPDFHRRDLWEAIESGNYPEWELGFQLFDEAGGLRPGRAGVRQ